MATSISLLKQVKGKHWKEIDSITLSNDWDFEDIKRRFDGISESIDEQEWPYEYMLYQALSFNLDHEEQIPHLIKVPEMTRTLLEQERVDRAKREAKNETEIKKWSKRGKSASRKSTH